MGGLVTDDLLYDVASPELGNRNGDVTMVEFFDYRCPQLQGDGAAVGSPDRQGSRAAAGNEGISDIEPRIDLRCKGLHWSLPVMAPMQSFTPQCLRCQVR
jgi:hypothetical protein